MGGRSERGDGGDRQPGPPLPTSGQSVSKCGHTKTPAQHDAVRACETILRLLYWLISYSKPDDPGGGATLFLAGEDHGRCEIAK